MAHSDFVDTRRYLAIRDKMLVDGEYVGRRVYKAADKPAKPTPKPSGRKASRADIAARWEAERMAKLAQAYKVEDTTRALKSVGNGL